MLDEAFAEFAKPSGNSLKNDAITRARDYLRKNPHQYFQQLFSLLNPLWQSAAALHRRSATEFAVALFTIGDQISDEEGFVAFVQAALSQCSDWHSVATGLLTLLTQILSIDTPLLTEHLVPQTPWLLKPRIESSNFRNRPIDNSRKFEDEVIDVSQLTRSLLPSPEDETSNEPFLLVSAESEVPLNIMIISAVFVFIFGPNFTPQVRESIYALLETAISRHAESIRRYIGHRFVAECLYQMIDEVAGLEKALRILNLIGEHLSDLRETNADKLLEDFLLAYLPLEDQTSLRVLQEPVKEYAQIWWSNEALLPRFFDHSLDLMAALVDRSDIGNLNRLANLIAVVARNAPATSLNALMVPVVELGKLCLWTSFNPSCAEAFSAVIFECGLCQYASYARRLLEGQEEIVDLSVYADGSIFRDLKPSTLIEQTASMLFNLRALLIRAGSASGKAPHPMSAPFKAAMCIATAIAKSSLIPSILTWILFRDYLVKSARDDDDEKIGQLRLEALDEISKILISFLIRYSDFGGVKVISKLVKGISTEVSVTETATQSPYSQCVRLMRCIINDDETLDDVQSQMNLLSLRGASDDQIQAFIKANTELNLSPIPCRVGQSIITWAASDHQLSAAMLLKACSLIGKTEIVERPTKIDNFDISQSPKDFVVALECREDFSDKQLSETHLKIIRKAFVAVNKDAPHLQDKMKEELHRISLRYTDSSIVTMLASELKGLDDRSFRCVPNNLANEVFTLAFADFQSNFASSIQSQPESFDISLFHQLVRSHYMVESPKSSSPESASPFVEEITSLLDGELGFFDHLPMYKLIRILSFLSCLAKFSQDHVLSVLKRADEEKLRALLTVASLGYYTLQSNRPLEVPLLPIEDFTFFEDTVDVLPQLLLKVAPEDALIHIVLGDADFEVSHSSDETEAIIAWHVRLLKKPHLIRDFIQWFNGHLTLEIHKLLVCGVMCRATDELAKQVRDYHKDDNELRLKYLKEDLIPLLSKVLGSLSGDVGLGSQFRVVRSVASLFTATVVTLLTDIKSEAQQLARAAA